MVGIITQVGSRDRAKNNVGSGIPGTRGEFFVLEEVSLLGQGTRTCREKQRNEEKEKIQCCGRSPTGDSNIDL